MKLKEKKNIIGCQHYNKTIT